MTGEARWLDVTGVAIAPVGVPFGWWRDAAVRLDAAGYAGIWTWDHLASRGTGRPVLEAWTTLAAVAPLTSRATLGTLVTNVMTRHPALLARIVATLHGASGGRVRLGLGIGGDEAEARAHGLPMPPVAERVARFEEAAAVLRLLWAGGRATNAGRSYPLDGAPAEPRLDPTPPIIVAGQTPAGARLAARAGDGWTTPPDRLTALLPIYREARAAAGRDPGRIVVGWDAPRFGVDAVAGTPWADDPVGELASWLARGADEVVLVARTDTDLAALERMAAR